MLEIRENCEHCNKSLPNESSEAMICTFECTFCSECVEHVLENVCPNCGGGFEKRPTRPKNQIKKYPASNKKVLKPVRENKYLETNKSIDPRER
ncbi:MAG: DUF1272 domain-containing protein [Bacteroidia bacterium]|nr:DUF1272 domain-containing protein [Bacteroidia bacterium]NNL82595.1 DUF1272 domain-containing protein [Winogradskyella sp.]